MAGTETVIDCRNVWKVFGPQPGQLASLLAANPSPQELREAGYVAAVRDVNISIPRGEMLVVMGLSGSGKSTLVRCMSRLLDISAGRVEVEGQDIGKLSESQLIDLRRRRMGMVFQSFGLLPHRNVLDNVAFPLEMRGQPRAARIARAREMLALVGLEGREEHFPRELSGGQQQRVGIARSLAIEPAIWFLDEPFSALDPLIRREMQDEFLRLKGTLDKTIVFITHDFDEALRLADRIAIMKDGAVEQCDTPDRIVMAPATPYVAKFTAEIDRARVVRLAALAGAAQGVVLEGPPLPGDAVLHAVARDILADRRTHIPVAGPDGALLGQIERQAALNLILGDRP
ncbi:glycine betaine/proline transport system ATP-binding protein [Paracoccus aminovorans]|uniref:Trimethylamine N-oxide transport system ATP-binding protein TmoW n=1 Tax=Paracoccus aminovorans TaxID=34004 RepID=A0A1I3B431_9RHOB|nr:ATP-binding cassette domain-containing protein [Paracoccus aminovorans]CQR87556.1 glycine betaine/proline ABC transporter, ATP-binding protein [Paracoccus aminovorans]SFH57044.1 glycine betaine/proline transport system ATP-binding protein [Paracoccus aminovorans]